MRKMVWDLLLDADMNARYWSQLSRRYYRREKWVKIFLAIMASGTVASWGFWSQYGLLWKVLSGVSAIIAIILPILNWPKSIQNMNILAEKWSQIKNDYEMLWLDVKDGVKDKSKAKKDIKKIKEKENTLSQQEANLPDDKKLLRECFAEVKKSRGI